MSKTKTKSRFNFVDVIIILAIIAVIAAIVWIVLVQSGTVKTEKTVRVEYTVRFTLVREEFSSYVKTGDVVIINSSNTFFMFCEWISIISGWILGIWKIFIFFFT